MLVSEYRTFIAPSIPTKKSEQSSQKVHKKAFILPKQESFYRSRAALRTSLPNFIYNKNYYTNKERLLDQKDTDPNLTRFRYLAKAKQIPKAYSTPFVTFMDLTKPKKALTATPLVFPQKADDNYKQSLLTTKRSLMLQTYQANDLYYKQVYAS
ncbi:hypothetical protein MNB_SM-7-367 [hydrothermal vent metagenome]|uniref:Uncharacterized protein n=1 Tax=hydrothermal vent metagenome TaxID=652676 RepID=A0A1W1BRY0_9ZZZZ